MTLEDDLKQEVQTIIMEIMMVLHKHGIKEVHMGAILRLMGVDEEKARLEDNERIYLDEKFTKYIERMLELAKADTNEQTLH